MAAQLVEAIREHAWLAPLIPAVWLVLKMVRTAARIACARAWDRVLQRKGVSEEERHKLITDAAQRDLKST